MPKKIVPGNFKTNLIEQFIESVSEPANTSYYAFLGNHIASGQTEGDVSQPTESPKTLRVDSYRDMIFGKKYTNEDFKVMCKRHDWVEGTVYTMYDDVDPDLYNKNFIVAVDETAFIHVYKVLSNANGAPSTTKPVFADVRYDNDLFNVGDNFYETDDGYQWKYMYSIDSGTFRKFATQNYIPVVANTVAEGNALNGSIDVIKVDTHGKGYDNYVSARFEADDLKIEGSSKKFKLPANAKIEEDFYKNTILHLVSGTGAGQFVKVIASTYNVALDAVIIETQTDFEDFPDTTTLYELSPEVLITSDGTQSNTAIARAVINSNASNSVHKVEVLNPGKDYSFSTAEVLKGGVPINGFYDDVVDAEVRPISPPPGGHGANTNIEVGGSFLSLYVNFERDEGNTAPSENTFAQFGIIRDPRFSNVEIEVVKGSDGSPGVDGQFVVGEEVLQIETLKLYSQVSVVPGNTYIEANESDTNYADFVKAGDYLFIEDNVTSTTRNFVSKIDRVQDANTIILEDAPNWADPSNIANAYLARIISSSTVKQIASSDRLFLNAVDDNFAINKTMIGTQSYSVCSPSTINIGNRFNTGLGENFDFTKFNQMTRCEGTIIGGPFTADERVFQIDSNGDEVSSAFVHSTDTASGSIYLTRVSGTIQTELDIEGEDSLAVMQGSIATIDKYEGDLDPTSGTIIFLQNDIPVIRDENQSEEIRIILEF